MSSNENPKIPQHVAIIMDGDRRWSHSHNVEEIEGHKRSVDRIRELVEYAAKIGVKSITFWAFSTENWGRSQSFLNDLFSLFRHVLFQQKDFYEDLTQSGGRMHVLGDLSKFPADIVNKVNEYLNLPGPSKKIIDVNIALNYGGRDELLRALKKIVGKGTPPEQITAELVSESLDTAGQPDVDLMIRTGGELRTSGFLMWQLNYAEFYFPKTYFPDFGVEEFKKALNDFALRDRRFGGDTKAAA